MSQTGDTFGPCYKCVHFYHYDGCTIGVIFCVCEPHNCSGCGGVEPGSPPEEGRTARLFLCSRATSPEICTAWEWPLSREGVHSPQLLSQCRTPFSVTSGPPGPDSSLCPIQLPPSPPKHWTLETPCIPVTAPETPTCGDWDHTRSNSSKEI